MPTTTVITTAIGASDTVINNGGGQFNDINTSTQLAAAARANHHIAVYTVNQIC